MELWIRSQDKERLIKVFDVYITGTYENIVRANYKGHYSCCEYVDLGEYNSTSRALEVLDEIHQRLIDLQTLEILQDSSFTKRSLNCVYQMPSE